MGADAHSVSADPLFVNPGQGDFRVRPESPAFKIGFRNFDMTDFGVKSEKLKKLARTPDIPEIVLQIQDEVSAEYTWLGVVLKNFRPMEPNSVRPVWRLTVFQQNLKLISWGFGREIYCCHLAGKRFLRLLLSNSF